jgi:hypothetical protein
MRIALVLLAGCGSSPAPASIDAATTHDAAIDSAAGALALTSPELASGTFPDANTCTGPGNTSPQFLWTGDTHAAQSFALTLTDPDAGNLIHWTIYDIPGSATGLPADVMKAYAPANVSGAHQTDSYMAGMKGYLGPCPPALHHYRFDLYALDVATLPGTSMATTRAEVVAAAMQHVVATATLMASYQKP